MNGYVHGFFIGFVMWTLFHVDRKHSLEKRGYISILIQCPVRAMICVCKKRLFDYLDNSAAYICNEGDNDECTCHDFNRPCSDKGSPVT